MLRSWFSRGTGYVTINPHEYVESDSESESNDDNLDTNEVSRQVSDIRLYDLTRSYDSFNVEAKMIKGLKTHKEHIKD